MSNDAGQYLVEFIQIGSSVKVSAVDPVTGREVSIVGPASASRNQLSSVAVKKLKYVLSKEKL
ncbi:MAG: hypothetical protein JKY45_06115 [Emcibacter sp.]|nr:hypothetical protein [Emcibacter sp.]